MIGVTSFLTAEYVGQNQTCAAAVSSHAAALSTIKSRIRENDVDESKAKKAKFPPFTVAPGASYSSERPPGLSESFPVVRAGGILANAMHWRCARCPRNRCGSFRGRNLFLQTPLYPRQSPKCAMPYLDGSSPDFGKALVKSYIRTSPFRLISLKIALSPPPAPAILLTLPMLVLLMLMLLPT